MTYHLLTTVFIVIIVAVFAILILYDWQSIIHLAEWICS